MSHKSLLNAIKQGNLNKVRSILANLLFKDENTLHEMINGNYGSELGFIEQEITAIPLHLATVKNNALMVTLLLQYGADPSVKDAHGRDALKIALNTPHTDHDRIEDKITIIDQLCLHGAILANDELEKQTASMIEYLGHPNPKARVFKQSILERVLFESVYTDFLQYIAENDIQGMQNLLEKNSFFIPVSTEKISCRLDVINDANHPYYRLHILEASCLQDPTILKYLHEKCGISLHIRDKHGNTLLHLASLFGSYETTKYLLEKGADRDSLNHALETPLKLCKNLSCQVLLIRYWPEHGRKPANESHEALCQDRLDRFLGSDYKRRRANSPLLWRTEPDMVPDSDPSDHERDDPITEAVKRRRLPS